MDFRKYVLLSSVGGYVNYEYRREADTRVAETEISWEYQVTIEI